MGPKSWSEVEPAVNKKLSLADVAGGSFLMERGGKALLPLLHYYWYRLCRRYRPDRGRESANGP